MAKPRRFTHRKRAYCHAPNVDLAAEGYEVVPEVEHGERVCVSARAAQAEQVLKDFIFTAHARRLGGLYAGKGRGNPVPRRVLAGAVQSWTSRRPWRRRLWIVWLEGALNKIELAGWWLHGIWIVSIIVLGPLLVFGSDVVQQQVSDVYLVRSLGLVGAALVLATVAGLFTFVAWWLRTLPGERLRSAHASAKTLPPIGIMGAAITTGAMIEHRVTGSSVLVQCATTVVGMLLIGAYHWCLARRRADSLRGSMRGAFAENIKPVPARTDGLAA
jgi:hypothetical protein